MNRGHRVIRERTENQPEGWPTDWKARYTIGRGIRTRWRIEKKRDWLYTAHLGDKGGNHATVHRSQGRQSLLHNGRKP